MRTSSSESSEYVSLLNQSGHQNVSLLNQSDHQKYSPQNTISSKVKTTSTFFNVFQRNSQKNHSTNQQNIIDFNSFNKKQNYFKNSSIVQNQNLSNSLKSLKPVQQRLNIKDKINLNKQSLHQYQSTSQNKNAKYNFSPFYGRSKSNQAHLLDNDDKKQIKRLKTQNAQFKSTIVNLRFNNQNLKNRYQDIKNKYQQITNLNILLKKEIVDRKSLFQQNEKKLNSQLLKNKNQIFNLIEIIQKLNQQKNYQTNQLNSNKLTTESQPSFIKKQKFSQIYKASNDCNQCKQLQQKNFILQDTNNQLNQKINWLNQILHREKLQLQQLANQLKFNANSFMQKDQQNSQKIDKLKLQNDKFNQQNNQLKLQNNKLKQQNNALTKQKQHYLQLINDMEIKVGNLNEHNNVITKNNKKQIQSLQQKSKQTQNQLVNRIQTMKIEMSQLKNQKEYRLKLQQDSSLKSNQLMLERQSLLEERLIISNQQIQNLKVFLAQKQQRLMQLISQTNQQKIYMLQQYKALQQQFTSSTLFFKNKVNTLESQNIKMTDQLKNQKFQAQNDQRLFQNKIIYLLKKENEDLKDQNMYFRCGYNQKQTAYYRSIYSKSLQKQIKSQNKSSKLKKSSISEIKDSQQSSINAENKNSYIQKAFKNKLLSQQKNNFNARFQPQFSRQRPINIETLNNIVPVCISPQSYLKLQKTQKSQNEQNLKNFDKKQKQIQQRYENFMKLLKSKFGIGNQESK